MRNLLEYDTGRQMNFPKTLSVLQRYFNIEASKAPKFTPGKALKEAVNQLLAN